VWSVAAILRRPEQGSQTHELRPTSCSRNTGDSVESCSALAEREDGTLTLLAFVERARAATARRGGSG